MKDECINCGAWKGLHDYETNQCPRNGQEAPLGKLQEWDNTVYQEDNTAELRAKIAEQAATIARLTAANESMQEDAVQNTYAFGQMLHANKEQAAEIEQIKEQVQETLDLLRTGCAPDAFNMDEKQWMSHKINRAASFLSAMLRGKK